MSVSYPSSGSSPTMQGWLLKQRPGLCKSWSRRYFVLEGSQLTYYKQETDTIPRQVLDLESYHVTTDVAPAALPHLLKRNTSCQHIFLLTSNDKKTSLFLQAETKEELDIWVNALEQLKETKSVLDKWLERLDMSPNTSPRSVSFAGMPPLPLSSHSQRLRGASASIGDIMSGHLSLKDRPPLRYHHSAESITSSGSSSVSHRSASIEIHRAPHNDVPQKRLVSFLHHWPRSKPPREAPLADSLSSSSSSSLSLATPSHPATTTVIAPEIPIIRPCDYNDHRPLSMHHPTSTSTSTSTVHVSRGRSYSSVALQPDDDVKHTQHFVRAVTAPLMERS